MLRLLAENSIIPWVCARDFNEIMEDSEKCGGVNRATHLMENFREAVIDAGLIEVNLGGLHFLGWGKERTRR